MPVNFLEIREQIMELGQRARLHDQQLRSKLEQAKGLLEKYANQPDVLLQRIDRIVRMNSGLRCALPVSENLNVSVPVRPAAEDYVILAADGSQINPSRHDPVEFGVINVGVIRIVPGRAEVPSEFVNTRLLSLEDLETPDGPIGEEVVALRRDLREREVLADLADSETLPVVTLSDGPLELFREPREQNEYRRLFEYYLQALGKLHELNSAVAGYVDKPKADLLVRALELMTFEEDQLAQAGRTRPLRGVTDAMLLANTLGLGERSAVMGIQSISAQKFTDELSLHFFYLNTGFSGHMNIARVEIPAWVARDEAMLNRVHTALVEQCRQMGARPYPYALHRAHEVALVSFDEKRRLAEMIAVELRSQGAEVGDLSNKQYGKDVSGNRTRYKL